MTKAHNRTALLQCLIMREKPLAAGDAQSLARSYGVPVDEVERLASEHGL